MSPANDAAEEIWQAVSGIKNERIDVPARRRSSAYCKASRSMDCAFGFTVCGANSFGRQNLLLPLYRARLGLRALWIHGPLRFRFLAPYETRAGLRLDSVSGVVGL